MMGTLYGVSVGAGDPQLMTLKAVRIIEACSVIAVPRTGGENSVALSIAEQTVDISAKRVIYLDFPMASDKDILDRAHSVTAKQLCTELKSNDIAFLTLGDISIYSTFCYIADSVRAAGFNVEVCAGVTSFSAATAALAEPLCLGSEELHIIPYSSSSIENSLQLSGTKVIMKAGRHTQELISLLRSKGLAEHTKAVVNCGFPDERLYVSIDDMPEAPGYFTLFIITDRESRNEA